MNQEIKTMIEQFCHSSQRLITMTGAIHLLYDNENNSFSFKFPMCKKANYCKISYNYGKDLYEMSFSKLSSKSIKTVAEFNNIFAEQLKSIFEDFTGLDLSL